jgi:hypothetical protein
MKANNINVVNEETQSQNNKEQDFDPSLFPPIAFHFTRNVKMKINIFKGSTHFGYLLFFS